MTSPLHAYQAELEPVRRRLVASAELQGLMAPEPDPGHLHAFLVQWASLSVQLHEPCEQFLAEASRSCAKLHEARLALTMLHIAVDAIDIYRLLADDTRVLAQVWNARRLPRLDMTSLLTQPATPAVRHIHDLHREFVLGADPWAELAVVFEIQALLAGVAERVVEQSARVLGDEIRPGLCSLRTMARHGDDSSLSLAMAACLNANPTRHEVMVAAGTRTLERYAEFLHECWVASFNLSNWQSRQHA